MNKEREQREGEKERGERERGHGRRKVERVSRRTAFWGRPSTANLHLGQRSVASPSRHRRASRAAVARTGVEWTESRDRVIARAPTDEQRQLICGHLRLSLSSSRLAIGWLALPGRALRRRPARVQSRFPSPFTQADRRLSSRVSLLSHNGGGMSPVSPLTADAARCAPVHAISSPGTAMSATVISCHQVSLPDQRPAADQPGGVLPCCWVRPT